MRPRRPWLLGMTALLFIALAGFSLPVPWTSPPATNPPATGGLLAALEETLEHIYTQVNPSVVNVQVEQRQVARSSALPETSGIPSRRVPSPQEAQELIRRGVGSGFVWDSAGHIVTNHHVVADADRITVTLHDGTEVPAKAVGTDPESAMAPTATAHLPMVGTPNGGVPPDSAA